MARIPVQIASRPLETGSVIQLPTGDPVGAAVAQAGQRMSELGARLQERNSQIERFAALQKLDEMNTELLSDTDKAKQKMEPGAIGLHDNLVKAFDDKSSSFLKDIPPHLRTEFQARVQASRARFSRGAALIEAEESRRFQVSTIDDRLKSAKITVLKAGPETVGDFVRDVEELIDNSPSISPAERAEKKKLIRQDLQETGFRSEAARDPAKAAAIADGWGLDQGFSGSAQDRAMQLLRAKEGFKTSTYFDVNAHRVGYGSDTITDAAGNVRQVKQGDIVTREDAERDLKRRTGAVLGDIRDTVGAASFDKLSPNTQAALASVAYNYGKMPDSVAAAAKSGDAERIARSIEGLQGHNEGVNRQRRLSEAALARSPGDGPVAGVHQADARFSDIPAERRFILAGLADQELRRKATVDAAAQTANYNAKFNDLQTKIIDNQATTADVLAARKEGWLSDAGDIQRLNGQIAQRDKGMADVQAFSKAMASPGFVWNPVDKEHKDWVDAGFRAQGGDMKSLQTIVDRTGVLPASAATALRGGVVSSNPQQVANSLSVASNLLTKNPNIFAAVEGKKELEENAIAFRHYVDDLGMTADQAAQRIIRDQSPEYQASVKAKIKAEDIDAKIKKELSIGDLEKAFDNSILPFNNPSVGFDPGQRQTMYSQYAELVRENYLESGDMNKAKALAAGALKKTWGVSNVNGSAGITGGGGVVMQYPPERSPQMAGIENVSELIAKQAIDDIKAGTGQDIPRSKLRLAAIPGVTGPAFKAGRPVPYQLEWEDRNGVTQMLNPGKAWVADPVAMRSAQTAGREKAFNREREIIEARRAEESVRIPGVP